MNVKSANYLPVYFVGSGKPIKELGIHAIHIQNVEELPVSEPTICILALVGEEQDHALSYLHASSVVWNGLVYVLENSRLSDYLSDGIWSASHIEHWHLHQTKLALIKEEPSDKLLAWLWLGHHRRLKPFCDSSKPTLYSYPLLDCYFGEEQTPYNYLHQEKEKGYLDKESTVDRIRQCPACHSGHQNYIETCPSCKSTDIEEMLSLHCFTCGHVAKQEQFTRRGKLECPTCLTQLRHIGVDYDRPLENYKCLDCDLHFSESIVRVRCLSCCSNNEVNDLIMRRIDAFKAGEEVKHLMVTGRRRNTNQLVLDGLVDDNSFHYVLVWINKLAIRHQQQHIVLGMKLSGVELFSQQYGELKLLQLMDKIAGGLNAMLRDTDICCQYRTDMVLILMPMTDVDSLPVLESKVQQIGNKIESELITLDVHVWPLPDSDLNDRASQWLIDKLGYFDNE